MFCSIKEEILSEEEDSYGPFSSIERLSHESSVLFGFVSSSHMRYRYPWFAVRSSQDLSPGHRVSSRLLLARARARGRVSFFLDFFFRCRTVTTRFTTWVRTNSFLLIRRETTISRRTTTAWSGVSARRAMWTPRFYWVRWAGIRDGQTESRLESVPFRRWGLSVTEREVGERWWWRCRGGGGGDGDEQERERTLKRNSFSNASTHRVRLNIYRKKIILCGNKTI